MRPRVLIADDYPDIVKAISRLLSPDCDIVGTVAEGSALLETAQRLQPERDCARCAPAPPQLT